MKMQLLLAFSYLLAEKISCSAELSMKKSFITSGSGEAGVLLNRNPAFNSDAAQH